VRQPKPLKLKVKAETIFLNLETIKNAIKKNESCQHSGKVEQD
jgi:hypothetical protein